MKTWPILLCGILLSAVPSLAQELDVNDLRRPGKPLVERYTIPGLGGEGRSIIQRFGEVDDQRVARAIATTSSAPQSIICKKSSEMCFSIVKKSDAGMHVTIRCEKGSGYKIGKEHSICGNRKGKWATGCGVSDSFAHHYTFVEAGNNVCTN